MNKRNLNFKSNLELKLLNKILKLGINKLIKSYYKIIRKLIKINETRNQ